MEELNGNTASTDALLLGMERSLCARRAYKAYLRRRWEFEPEYVPLHPDFLRFCKRIGYDSNRLTVELFHDLWQRIKTATHEELVV